MYCRLFGVYQTSVRRPYGLEVARLHRDVPNALAVVLEAQRGIVPVLREEDVDFEVRRDLVQTAHVLKRLVYDRWPLPACLDVQLHVHVHAVLRIR